MFQSARIKLTIWYVIISMSVSIFFSAGIFYIFHREFTRNQRRIEFRLHMVQELHPEFRPPQFSRKNAIEASERSVGLNLLYVNMIILGISSVAGYFLAGRTLRPIRIMVDKQNQFIADASHELRTPLTSLKTGIEVNLRDNNLGIKQARTVLKENLHDVNNLQRLAEQLLLLATVGTGIAHSTDSVNIKDVIEVAIRSVSNQAKEKKISIRTEVENVTVAGDKKKLTDVFVIFLDNAIKYSPENSEVHIIARKTDGSAEIKVKDHGIGIESREIPRIFDRFYRADTSRSKHNASGYGLGLAIANRIIKSHNGSIHVESTVGKGSVFTIRLPVLKK